MVPGFVSLPVVETKNCVEEAGRHVSRRRRETAHSRSRARVPFRENLMPVSVVRGVFDKCAFREGEFCVP